MTKYPIHHKNYTQLGETYQLVLPLCLEGLISEDESVRLLSHELEELDYTLLYQTYSAKGRNPAVDPKTMFKILLLCLGYNINKLHAKIQNDRLGNHLFPLKTA